MKRIKQIAVTNLFGIFNHVIPLKMNERITIIHAPNGFGKTIILRLLSELFSEKSLEELFSQSDLMLLTTPFEELRVNFDDDSSLWIVKGSGAKGNKQAITEITFHATAPQSRHQSFSLPAEVFTTSGQQWKVASSVYEEELRREFDLTIAEEYHQAGKAPQQKEPDWLREMRQAIPVRFIETQRLLNLTQPRRRVLDRRVPGNQHTATPAVKSYSDALASAINTKLAESTALSQSLDRTFPARVVNPETHHYNLIEEQLREKLTELEKKRARLTAVGLLDQGDNAAVQVSGQIDQSTKVMLSIYVEDTEKKLGIFNEIADRIELLKKIINKRFLYKSMEVSKERGFIFKALDGTMLSPTGLSSGEQHELVLFYELLFKVDRGSLILIDEPELSLHVVWQEQFLRDLQEAIGLADFDAIIATHSPDIIDGRRDLVIEMEGPN